MKPHRIMGVLAAGACIVAAILQISPLFYFFDLPSLLLVCVGSTGMVAATYGRGAGRLFSAIMSWFFGSDSELSSPEEHREIASMAREYGQYALMAGAVGTVIGHVQMLQNMSDPSAIGPALAVSLLTLFYGGLMHMMIAVPLSQHHLQLAGLDGTEFNHRGPGLRMLGVLGICTGISFFVMLLAMSDRFY